jgi:hypothetical protein
MGLIDTHAVPLNPPYALTQPDRGAAPLAARLGSSANWRRAEMERKNRPRKMPKRSRRVPCLSRICAP